MGIISALKRVFDVPKLMGVEQIKSQTNNIKDMAEGLIRPRHAIRNETFEEALKRLNLTESDLQGRTKALQGTIVILTIIACSIVLYIIYLLSRHSYLASAGCVGILLVILGQIFQQHFWLYQIRQRRLGCTFREWLHSLRRVKS